MADSQRIESFITFLIEHNIVDNSPEAETLSKFLQVFETFEDQVDNDSMNQSSLQNDDS